MFCFQAICHHNTAVWTLAWACLKSFDNENFRWTDTSLNTTDEHNWSGRYVQEGLRGGVYKVYPKRKVRKTYVVETRLRASKRDTNPKYPLSKKSSKSVWGGRSRGPMWNTWVSNSWKWCRRLLHLRGNGGEQLADEWHGAISWLARRTDSLQKKKDFILHQLPTTAGLVVIKSYESTD